MGMPRCGTSPITVAIAGRSDLVRRGLRAIIETAYHIARIGEATTAAEAAGLIEVQSPHVLLIEMELGLDITGLTRHIKTAVPAIKIIVLHDVEDALPMWDILSSGVGCIVLSNQPPTVLLATIEYLLSTYLGGPLRWMRLFLRAV